MGKTNRRYHLRTVITAGIVGMSITVHWLHAISDGPLLFDPDRLSSRAISSGPEPRSTEFGIDLVDMYFPFPKETSFREVKYNDIGLTGDLTISIPLIDIPGRAGLGYSLTANYGQPIKVTQKAGHIGLGWSLNLGSITCEPNFTPDIDWQIFYLYDYSSSNPVTNPWLANAFQIDSAPDNYNVSGPFGTSPLISFIDEGVSRSEWGKAPPDDGNDLWGNLQWTMTNFRQWRVEPIEDSSFGTIYDDGNIIRGDYSSDRIPAGFVITTEDGTRYVFDHPLLSRIVIGEGMPFWYYEKDADLWYYHGVWDFIMADTYISEWKLTEILSSDYIDTNGNGLPDPSDGGDYVLITWDYDGDLTNNDNPDNDYEFDNNFIAMLESYPQYSPRNAHNRRIYRVGQPNEQQALPRDWTRSFWEATHPYSIATPTHVVRFEIESGWQDDASAESYGNLSAQDHERPKIIRRIQLYKNDGNNGPEGVAIEEVAFDYANDDPSAFNDPVLAVLRHNRETTADPNRSGSATLTRITVSGGSSSLPPYQFTYYGQEDGFFNPDYERKRDVQGGEGAEFIWDDQYNMDMFGYYMYYDPDDPWNESKNIWRVRDNTGYHPDDYDSRWRQCAAAWSLKSVTYPTGGTATYEYENDVYHRSRSPGSGVAKYWAGGTRVAKITLSGGLNENPDNIVTYRYGNGYESQGLTDMEEGVGISNVLRKDIDAPGSGSERDDEAYPFNLGRRLAFPTQPGVMPGGITNENIIYDRVIKTFGESGEGGHVVTDYVTPLSTEGPVQGSGGEQKLYASIFMSNRSGAYAWPVVIPGYASQAIGQPWQVRYFDSLVDVDSFSAIESAAGDPSKCVKTVATTYEVQDWGLEDEYGNYLVEEIESLLYDLGPTLIGSELVTTKWVKTVRVDEKVDGISAYAKYEYNPRNGRISSLTEQGEDSEGDRVTLTDFGFIDSQIASTMLDKHMIDQVYQTRIYQDVDRNGSFDKLLSSDKQEWSDSFTAFDQVYADARYEWLDTDGDLQIDSGEWVAVLVPDQYDVFGHIVKSHDALGNYAHQYYGDNNQAYAYPDDNGEYSSGDYFAHSVLTGVQKQIGSKDAPGNPDDDLVIHASYFENGEGNGRFMRLKEVYDPNRSVNSFEYDGLGRITKRLLPVYGLITFDYNYALDSGSLTNTNLNWIKTKQFINSSAPYYKIAYAYFDGLGRSVLTRQEANGTGDDIYIKTTYDEIGRVKQVYDPFVAAESYDYGINGQNGYSVTAYWSDPLSRVYRTFPNYQDLPSVYNEVIYEAGGEEYRVTEARDAEGKYSEAWIDRLGYEKKFLEGSEDGDSYESITTFSRDLIGKVVTVTDARGRVIESNRYDTRGRLTARDRLDMVGQPSVVEEYQLAYVEENDQGRYCENPVRQSDVFFPSLTMNEVKVRVEIDQPFDCYGDQWVELWWFDLLYEQWRVVCSWTDPDDTGEYTFPIVGYYVNADDCSEQSMLAGAQYRFRIMGNGYTPHGGGNPAGSYGEPYVSAEAFYEVESGEIDETWRYDAMGNVIAYADPVMNDAGVELQYEYDDLNRRSRQYTSDGSLQTFYHYDDYDFDGDGSDDIDIPAFDVYGIYLSEEFHLENPKGHLTRVDNGNESIVYYYDGRGRVGERRYFIDGDSYTFRYKHGFADQLLARTLDPTAPHGGVGNTIEYTYDELLRLVSVEQAGVELIREYTYNPDATIESMVRGNSISSYFSYNELNLLSGFSTMGLAGGEEFDRSFIYDNYGNITEIWDGSLKIGDYDYDLRNWLDFAVVRPSRSFSGDFTNIDYEYDEVGNRTRLTVGSQVNPYTYHMIDGVESNRLMTAVCDGATFMYTYDDNGNVTRREGSNNQVIEMEYDHMNRMTSVSPAGSVPVEQYIYGAEDGDKRIKKITGTHSYTYIYDDHAEPVYEEKESNMIRNPGLDTPIEPADVSNAYHGWIGMPEDTPQSGGHGDNGSCVEVNYPWGQNPGRAIYQEQYLKRGVEYKVGCWVKRVDGNSRQARLLLLNPDDSMNLIIVRDNGTGDDNVGSSLQDDDGDQIYSKANLYYNNLDEATDWRKMEFVVKADPNYASGMVRVWLMHGSTDDYRRAYFDDVYMVTIPRIVQKEELELK